VIFGLTAAVGWGLADFFGAISGRRIGAIGAVISGQLLSALFITTVVLVTGESLAPLGDDLWLLALNGVATAFAYATHYRALELGPVAVVSPIGANYAVVAFVLAVVLLGERPGAAAIVGGLITIMGVVLVSTNIPAMRAGLHEKPPGLWWAVGSSLGFGIAGLLLGVIARDSDDWIVTLLSTRLALLASFAPLLFARRRTFDRLRGAGGRAHLTAAVAGLFDLMGVAAYSAGATRGYLSVVLAASAVFPVVAVALSMVFLRERLVVNQYLGVCAVVGGLLLLALGPG
jgi:uncharacterized membrane protein